MKVANTMKQGRMSWIVIGIVGGVLLAGLVGWAAAGAPGTSSPMWSQWMGGSSHGDGMGGHMDAGDSCGGCGSASPSAPSQVVMDKTAYAPATLTVRVGDTVTWTNQDRFAHDVASDEGSELASPMLDPGQSWSHTFTTPGTYRYHCTPHAWQEGASYAGMVGTIIVTE